MSRKAVQRAGVSDTGAACATEGPPIGPWGPTGPAGPATPAGPIGPCGPGDPGGPGGPGGPVSPTGPGGPEGPTHPATSSAMSTKHDTCFIDVTSIDREFELRLEGRGCKGGTGGRRWALVCGSVAPFLPQPSWPP